MEQLFVADGPERFFSSREYRARCCELRAAVEAKYAEAFQNAGLLRRLLIRYQRHREYTRALAKITPSAESLWIGGGALVTQTKASKPKSSSS